MFSPSTISFASLEYGYKMVMDEEIRNNEKVCQQLQKMNVFDYSFWEKGFESNIEKDISQTRHFIEKVIDKEASISSIKIFKKLIKGVHTTIPSYLKDMEKVRRAKEVVPDDFLSDEECKDQPRKEFKPPKPMKPGKRTLSSNGGKSLDGSDRAKTSFNPDTDAPMEDVQMQDEVGKQVKEYPEKMIVSLTLKEGEQQPGEADINNQDLNMN